LKQLEIYLQYRDPVFEVVRKDVLAVTDTDLWGDVHLSVQEPIYNIWDELRIFIKEVLAERI